MSVGVCWPLYPITHCILHGDNTHYNPNFFPHTTLSLQSQRMTWVAVSAKTSWKVKGRQSNKLLQMTQRKSITMSWSGHLTTRLQPLTWKVQVLCRHPWLRLQERLSNDFQHKFGQALDGFPDRTFLSKTFSELASMPRVQYSDQERSHNPWGRIRWALTCSTPIH